MFSLDPSNQSFVDSFDLILKIIGGIGAFTLFIAGFRRYKKDQVWRRFEFISRIIREFSSDQMVRNTMYMLDWGERYIELFPGKDTHTEKFAKVDRTILNSALQFHELKNKLPGKERFTETEVAIRDNFDHFLSLLERFEQFIVAGLITHREIEPYLEYWISSIAEEMEKQSRDTLFEYIDKYKFRNTQNLFKRFGKDIKPKKA